MATRIWHVLRARRAVRATVAAVVVGGALCASVATGGALPTASASPGDLPVDAHGFINSAARCEGPQRPVAVGRTARSLIAICVDGGGLYEYRGVRRSDHALLTEPATALQNGCFGVRNEDVDYTVSDKKLLVTSGLRIIRDEAMLQFEKFEQIVEPEAAPVSKTAGR
jgi:hypothetical protein